MENPSTAQLFKWLSDETRARLVLLIAQESELCVCELSAALAEPQPKVSRHLAQLRMGGILENRRQGQWVYYRISNDMPHWVIEILGVLLRMKPRSLSDDLKRLESMQERPVRDELLSS